jgi:hypothetical protein
MNRSGSSGLLRFESRARDEYFIVALGVHNYKQWTDLVTDLVYDGPGQTAAQIHVDYYTSGKPRDDVKWQLLTEKSAKNAKGRNVTVRYKGSQGISTRAAPDPTPPAATPEEQSKVFDLVITIG